MSSGPVRTRRERGSQANPDCGRIVCFCERVTRGEIDAALAGPIPTRDWTGFGGGREH